MITTRWAFCICHNFYWRKSLWWPCCEGQSSMDNHRYASKFRTAQSTVLGEEHFKDLVRNGISVKLQPEQRSLLVYGDSYLLAVSEYLHQLNRNNLYYILSSWQLYLWKVKFLRRLTSSLNGYHWEGNRPFNIGQPRHIAPEPSKEVLKVCVDPKTRKWGNTKGVATSYYGWSAIGADWEYSDFKLGMDMFFHQIELDMADRDITAFLSRDPPFGYMRLCFGVKSGPEQYPNNR